MVMNAAAAQSGECRSSSGPQKKKKHSGERGSGMPKKKRTSEKKRHAPVMPTEEELRELQQSESEEYEHQATLNATISPHLLNISPQLVDYSDTRPGEGIDCVKIGSCVLVDYTGLLATSGHCFDRSKAGAPLQFTIGRDAVVEGFEDGMLGMKLGGERTISVPAELGYGQEGLPGKIPPGAALRFNLKLVGLA